jgi:hypothetical protein
MLLSILIPAVTGLGLTWALPCFGNELQDGSLLATTSGERELRHAGKAEDLARQFGLEPLINQLAELSSKKQQDAATRLDALSLRQQLGDRIRHAMLEVMETTAAIDRDIAESDRLRDYLAGKRTRNDRRTNFTTFVSTGILKAVHAGLGFSENANTTIDVLRGTASGLDIMLPSSNMLHRYRYHGRLSSQPNMLAMIFNRSSDARSAYNKTVWKYLNSVPPDSRGDKTRRQELIESWVKQRELKAPSSAKGKSEDDLLAGTAPQGSPITIELLERRTSMLSDLKAEIVRMYRVLVELDELILSPQPLGQNQ